MEYLLSNMVDYIAREMPELMLVDEDYGQLENLDDEGRQMYPLTYPAVLVEPSRIDWSHLQGDSQKGEATIRVRLIIDCYEDTHAGSASRAYIRLREEMRGKLHGLLEGYRPLNDGGLMRKSSTFFTFNHGIKVYESTYTCTVTEVLTRGIKDTNTQPRVAFALGRL